MIYGRLSLKQAETVCLIARRARPHLTTLLGRGWGEGLPPGRLESMNQSLKNALRQTHGEWGGAQGVRHMVLQEGWGSGRGCPAPLLPQGLAGFGGAHQARPYPALPAAPSRGIAKRLALLTFALPSLPLGSALVSVGI